MKLYYLVALFFFLNGCQSKKSESPLNITNESYEGPIIDMHLHVEGENDIPPVKLGFCTPVSTMILSQLNIK